MTIFILFLLALSFAGYWSQRKALQPTTQSIISTAYAWLVVFVLFSGVVA